MEFGNEFRVSLPVEPAWELLGDVERIAPCMPGAQLTGADGDDYQGTVKVRVGPVAVQYKGTATIEARDRENRTLTLRAAGRDSRGQGNASAHVTAVLAEDGDGTRVTVTTQLSVTGKVAQFGKGVMEDISRKLLSQFTVNLEEMLAAEKRSGPENGAADPQAADTQEAPAQAESGPTAPALAAPAASAGSPAQATETATSGSVSTVTAAPATEAPAPAREVEPIDLLGVARGAVLKRLIPVVVVLVVIGVVIWLLVR